MMFAVKQTTKNKKKKTAAARKGGRHHKKPQAFQQPEACVHQTRIQGILPSVCIHFASLSLHSPTVLPLLPLLPRPALTETALSQE